MKGWGKRNPRAELCADRLDSVLGRDDLSSPAAEFRRLGCFQRTGHPSERARPRRSGSLPFNDASLRVDQRRDVAVRPGLSLLSACHSRSGRLRPPHAAERQRSHRRGRDPRRWARQCVQFGDDEDSVSKRLRRVGGPFAGLELTHLTRPIVEARDPLSGGEPSRGRRRNSAVQHQPDGEAKPLAPTAGRLRTRAWPLRFHRHGARP